MSEQGETQRRWDGWQIETGFLEGNLGDLSEYSWRYHEILREQLAAAFPGADIETTSQAGEGCLPYDCTTKAWGPDGNEIFQCDPDRVLSRIDTIQDKAWETLLEWAQEQGIGQGEA